VLVAMTWMDDEKTTDIFQKSPYIISLFLKKNPLLSSIISNSPSL
jgi:hypothetical protein